MQLVAHFAHWLLVENADPGKTFTAGKKSYHEFLHFKMMRLTCGIKHPSNSNDRNVTFSGRPNDVKPDFKPPTPPSVSSWRKSQQLTVYLVYWTLFIFTGWCQEEPSAALVRLPHGPDVSDRHRRWLWHAHVLHELNSHGNWSCQGRRRLGLLQVRSHQVDCGGYASTYCWGT